MKGVEIERDANGRAVAATARWRDDGGVQRKKKFTGAGCVGLAQKHKTSMESAKQQGSYVDVTNRTTVAAYARQWVEARPYAENTSVNRESQLTNHIEGTRLGGMKLVAVRRSDVQAWATERSKVLGPASTRLVLGLVRSAFAAAAQDRLIGHNPATGRFALPPAEVELVVPLLVEQIRSLAGALDRRKQAMALVQAATGVRACELLGLRAGDVDFLRREWRLREQLHRTARTLVPLKTPYSRRDLPMPQVAIEALAKHLEEFPANEDGFVFTDQKGRPWQYAAYNDAVVAAAGSAGLPHSTTHDFRHHFASILLEAGESVVVVAARLGHKDAKLVLSTYAHLMPNSEDRTRKAVDAAWRTLGSAAGRAPDVPSAARKQL